MENDTASTRFTDVEAASRRTGDCRGWSSGAKSVTFDDDSESFSREKLNLFREFVKKTLKDSTKNLPKEAVDEAERLDIKDRAVSVLCELLLGKHVVREIKTHRVLFLRFTHGNRKSQKYLLGGLERRIDFHKDSLMSKVPDVLKAFYDTDVLEKEVLIDWSRNVSDEYVSEEVAREIRERAEPFFEWLTEWDTEEETSSSEDENQ